MITEAPSAIPFEDVLTRNEILCIRDMGEKATKQSATTNDNRAKVRSSTVAWLENGWLRQRMWSIVSLINDKYFRFKLDEIGIPQYTVYGKDDHYGWHCDRGSGTEAYRKLSLTVQLSSREEYEGGDFQIMAASEPETLPKGIGAVIAFPAWVLHRVTPVTFGTRRSLVVWAHSEAPFK